MRAVGGLTTAEIANAFLVPEATMAQRISRAKQRIKASGVPFRMPTPDEQLARLRTVLHVLYLIFNEGYASSTGSELHRTELSEEAIRLTRMVHRILPDDPEVAGLLALMLLTDARRPARTSADGELIPLPEQDRTLWDRARIAEGVALLNDAMARGRVGEYQIQAAIAAIHDQTPRADDTDWPQILALYGLLEQVTGNPIVTLNRAVAAAMAHGPSAGLALLEGGGARPGRALPARRRSRASARDGGRHRRRRGALPQRRRSDDEPPRTALPGNAGGTSPGTGPGNRGRRNRGVLRDYPTRPSIFAAMIRSFRESPPMACVVSRTWRRPQPTSRSG